MTDSIRLRMQELIQRKQQEIVQTLEKIEALESETKFFKTNGAEKARRAVVSVLLFRTVL